MTATPPPDDASSDQAEQGTTEVPRIRLTVDGEAITVPEGSNGHDALRQQGIKGAVVIAMTSADDERILRDLAYVLGDGDVIESVPMASDEGRAVLRHSTAHVMAQAVQDLFPGTLLGIGPPIENGFYYDFAPEKPFTQDDLAAIEKRMSDISRQRQKFSRREISDDEAAVELAKEPFKLELIGLKGGADLGDGAGVEVGGAQLTMYDNLVGDERVWTDLCRGPHLPTTRDIPAFKLMRTAAAYWRGDQKNQQLQRIYGTAWESKDALKAHLFFLEEAERRDHRKLGAELDLFSFPDEIGSGLAVFHPKGGLIRRVMEDYSRVQHEKAGYSFVNTPHITKGDLFQTSGHLQWFADGMYPPMQLDAVGEKPGIDYYLKPMNCPMHNLIFRSKGRSYRELPLRLFEFGTVYRYEPSGVVHGLARARGFTQDDSHIYCTREQMTGELTSLLEFVLDLLRDYGLTDFFLELSTRDDSPKFAGNDEVWAEATQALQDVADASGLELVPDPGGAAFYGPKISVQIRDALGRSWQMSTIQVDFQQPDRFELEYQAADGTRQRPVMIHRALFGSIERFFAVLLEHYAGAFPVWLAPVQVIGIPIAERHAVYLSEVVAPELAKRGLRMEIDTADDRMQKKIVKARAAKVPYMFIAGDDDVEAIAVSIRDRAGEERRLVPLGAAIEEIAQAVATHAIS